VIAAEPSHTMGPSSAVPADLLRETDRPHRLPASAVAWLVVVGALPLAELALLSSRFDASVLEARGGWLAHAIGASGDLVRAALPLLAAALLVGAARLRVVRPALLGAFASARRPWAALLGHLACFGALVVLSPGVFSDPDPGAALLVAWVVTGLAAAALWVAALVPDVMRRGAGLLLGGTLLAGAALGILAAGAATVTRDWWEPLGRSTVWTGYYLLRALGVDAGVDPEHFLVGTRSFVVEITPYCSGYQGIGLMWVFLAAYLWLFRERLRFPRALWLLPIGTLLVWLLNAVRIAVLVLIGSAGHEDVAMGGFHYHAGTLLFCATALGIGTWAASSRTFGTVRRARSEPGENPTAAYVLPLLALLATSLVTGAFSRGGFDPLYAVRVVAAASVVWTMRARLAGAGWRPSWVGAALGLAGAGGDSRAHTSCPHRVDRHATNGRGGDRAAGGGAGVPRLPGAAADRGRVRRRVAPADHLASTARVVRPLRADAPRRRGRRRRRDPVRPRRASQGSARRRGPRARRDQRAARGSRPDEPARVGVRPTARRPARRATAARRGRRRTARGETSPPTRRPCGPAPDRPHAGRAPRRRDRHAGSSARG
jgi:exosortase/archaeosortase family protein